MVNLLLESTQLEKKSFWILGSKMLDSDHPQRSHRRRYEALSIGNIAFDTLSAVQEGRVIGKTSRGIFIKSANKWSLFISSELFCSPLTINLLDEGGLFEKITHGMPIQISSGQLIFQDAHLSLSTRNSAVWGPPLPSVRPLPESIRLERVISAAQQILKDKKGTGLAPLLPFFLDYPELQDFSSPDLSPFQIDLRHLIDKWRSSAYPDLINILISFLGKGTGLTPSGDDFVIGYLLALNRWGVALFPGYDPERLNHAIVDAAYENTTTLSANLLECAAGGQGDERLIDALDWLMSGPSPDPGFIDKMLGWGSSSGIDVFAGFAAALSFRADIIGGR